MSDEPLGSTGLLRIRDCCLFIWREDPVTRRRVVELTAAHCQACIDDLRRAYADLLVIDQRDR